LLVVDDEPNIIATLSEILSDEGYEVLTANRCEPVQALVDSQLPALVLLDVMLPDGSGIELLKKLKVRHPETEVVMISGHATVDMAVEATRAGAYDFVEKPLSLRRVLPTVARALERRSLALDRTAHAAAEEERFRIVGDSAAMRAVRQLIEQVAPTTARVLLTGESGTGKELAAYWLHRLSRRRDGPYVKLNCAAIPRDLMESEVFGHEKGAFTGAVGSKPGKFELADSGTIFLDEIGDMEPTLQPKLLRVLETGELERVGSTRTRKTDVRVIAATNKHISREVEAGRFRADLYHRLNVFTIPIPPLREHREDIPLLARHLLDTYCRDSGMSPKSFTPDAIEDLRGRDFPGNVRELKNVVERAAIITSGSDIDQSALVPSAGRGAQQADLVTRTRPLAQARDELEGAFLRHQLARCGWNITKAASELKVERSHLSRLLKQHGIGKPEPYAHNG
jgi:two-component system nitrogen regulation response regulator NtrX